MTRDQAEALIEYFETLQERTNHQSVMRDMLEKGYPEAELHEACQALSQIAGRDFGLL